VTEEQYLERRKLTFAQAEGVEPLPQPLKLKEVSNELRAILWDIFYDELKNSTDPLSGYSPDNDLTDPMHSILRDHYVYELYGMADDFKNDFEHHRQRLRKLFEKGDNVSVFGFIQYVLRHRNCPDQLAENVNWALQKSRAAYTIVDGNTICPVASAEEAKAIEQAFADIAKHELNGARAHLRSAAEFLTHGKYADSIRDSIHAVEAVARILDPEASKALGPALDALEKKSAIHGSLKKGFQSIYGYTSDEQGIRHSLLDDPKAAADMYDALFMIGTCASFITYLIGKARNAGIE